MPAEVLAATHAAQVDAAVASANDGRAAALSSQREDHAAALRAAEAGLAAGHAPRSRRREPRS